MFACIMTPGAESSTTQNGCRCHPWLALLCWFALCNAAGALGSLFTLQAVPTWYAGLAKPSWNPPAWVFGPVWTVLYVMMAVSAWLVWRGQCGPARTLALRWFLLQLLINAMWSPVFFGGRNPAAGFVVIVALWVSIVITLARFWKLSRPAAILLVPYLAWVSFASALNLALWKLN